VSIKLRLLLLIATSLLTALIVSLVSYVGNTRMSAAVNDNAVSMTALRNHMEADMMHDALRADVYSAMLVGLGKSTGTAAEVRDSINEHATHFREVLEKNLKLPVNPTIKSALEHIKPSLDTYIAAAERIVGLALDNPDSAQRELGTFNAAFSQLEEQMAALSELIESNTRDTSQATESAIRNANIALGAVLLASLLLLLGQGRWVTRSIMGPLKSANQIAQSIAHGNLSEPISEPAGKDEASTLIRSLATMQRDLRNMIDVVRRNAHGVSGMSEHVALGLHDEARGLRVLDQEVLRNAVQLRVVRTVVADVIGHAEYATRLQHRVDGFQKADAELRIHVANVVIVHSGNRDIDAAGRDLRGGRQIAVDTHDVRQAIVCEPLGDRFSVHAVAHLQGDRRILRVHLALRTDCHRQHFGDVAAERDEVDGRHAGLHAEELHELGGLAIRVACLVLGRPIGAGQCRREIATRGARFRSRRRGRAGLHGPARGERCSEHHRAQQLQHIERVRFHCWIPYSTAAFFDSMRPSRE